MIPRTHEEIEAQIREIQSRKKKFGSEVEERVGFGDSGSFDKEIYGSKNKFEGYSKSIAVDDDVEDEPSLVSKKNTYTAPAALYKEIAEAGADSDPFADKRRKTIAEKEDDYRKRHRKLVISPERVDPFADGGKTPATGSRTYKEVMREQWLKREESELRNRLISKAKEGSLTLMMESDEKITSRKVKKTRKKSTHSSMNKKQKRSRSSSSSSEYTDSDESPKRKAQKSTKSPERNYQRKHNRPQKNRGDSSSEEDSRYKSRESKTDRLRDTGAFSGVRVKEEPISEDERGRKAKHRAADDTRRNESRNQREDNRRRNESSDSRDRSSKYVKEQESEKEPEWGKKELKTEKKEGAKNAAKPDFGLSGKLTEDTNTYNGVVIKYSEPPEARKPKRRWRLYPFKGETSLPVLHIHRQSAYLMGRDRKVADIPIDHPSCSKQHAALQYRLVPFTRADGSKGRQIKLYVIDLESANGTYLNNNKIEPKKYYELKERDVVKFGYSSREYVLLHEHSKDSEADDDVNNDD
ncbi:smad nuclear-interacting protein 1 [Macrosteles quadrilineatus]|uniref:smad nuclear-interacting protein 1 n=1 Tax=Macrosteles quadrilineatus TaxID=74068 RepID=UPI0023E1E787|nr:smad nuclear-interacting protein 1 [Macrosteles quadrilineatus]